MSFKVERPSDEDRFEEAWKNTTYYLGEDQVKILQAEFVQCAMYRHWSLTCMMLGISGWPVAAMWDDMRQTCRDAQS